MIVIEYILTNTTAERIPSNRLHQMINNSRKFIETSSDSPP